jgi:hypothetical protein
MLILDRLYRENLLLLLLNPLILRYWWRWTQRRIYLRVRGSRRRPDPWRRPERSSDADAAAVKVEPPPPHPSAAAGPGGPCRTPRTTRTRPPSGGGGPRRSGRTSTSPRVPSPRRRRNACSTHWENLCTGGYIIFGKVFWRLARIQMCVWLEFRCATASLTHRVGFRWLSIGVWNVPHWFRVS